MWASASRALAVVSVMSTVEAEVEPEASLPKATDICLVCKKEGSLIEFAGWPCSCPSMCRKCAQKLSTGGKCRVCHEIFPEVKRIARA